jgi:L-threonylcarbamoyladenylate synthase
MRDPLAPAVRALGRGGLVVYPTDTLFGLAARAGDPAAVERLVQTKRRPAGLPISVMVSSTEEVDGMLELSEPARRFVRRALPGPFTVLGTPRPGAPVVPALRNADGTLGVRVPDHAVARELARRVGPITATSANRHGELPGNTLQAIHRSLGSDVDEYVDLPPAPSGRPSTLVDLAGDRPRPILRRRPRRTP